MSFLTNAFGARNTFRPQGAQVVNPFGSDAAGQARVTGLQGQGADIQSLLAGRAGNPTAAAPELSELLGMATAQARGQGPNPAQEQYRQNVNDAIRQMSGAVASTRGLSPALAARTAALGGAQMLGGAAGQAAQLQAQQQLAATQLAGGLAGTKAGLGAQYAGLASSQNLSEQQIAQAALANLNAQRVAMQQNLNSIGAGVAAQNTGIGAGLMGGVMNAAGGALGLLGLARGGRVVRAARGLSAPVAPREPEAEVAPAEAESGLPLPNPALEQPVTSPSPFDAPSLAPPGVRPGRAKSSLGQMGAALQEAGRQSPYDFRAYAYPVGQSYAPPVISPQSFAGGGQAGPGTDPEHENAVQIAERLAAGDPKSAAVVYAHMTGLPTTYTHEETSKALLDLARLHASEVLGGVRRGAEGVARALDPLVPDPVVAAVRSAVGGADYQRELDEIRAARQEERGPRPGGPETVVRPEPGAVWPMPGGKRQLSQRDLGVAQAVQDFSDPEARRQALMAALNMPLTIASVGGRGAAQLAARAREQGGFTFDAPRGRHVTQGYAVSTNPGAEEIRPDISGKAIREYVNRHEGLFMRDPAAAAGAWHDPASGQWYLDVSRVLPDRAAAEAAGLAAHQKAIFDLGRGETIPLRQALGGGVFRRDGHVPGHAEVGGDSERNDKVPAMLSPGEIVLPRSVAKAPDAPDRAADFVKHLVTRRRAAFGALVQR